MTATAIDDAFVTHGDAGDGQTHPTAVATGQKPGYHKTLGMVLHVDGYILRQITREGDLAIYEKKAAASAQESLCYEVVIIRRRDAFTVGDRKIEPAEYYPRNEDWGSFGWTELDRDAAFRKLRCLREVRLIRGEINAGQLDA